MTEEEFIIKVKKQSGYVGAIDVYRLIHFYTEKWGVIYTELPIEDELIYMWLKLQEDKPTTKVCKRCNIEKDLNSFWFCKNNKDNKNNYCSKCLSKKRKKI